MFSSALRSFVSNISSNYAIDSDFSFKTGPWRVHDAKKKSTGKSASVFVFDKKSLEPNAGAFGGRAAAVSLKKAHEEVIERLKKEASSLARLRHPNILELAEPVEETRNGGLMFATEPVTASLGHVLQERDDQDTYSDSGRDKDQYGANGRSGKSKRSKDYDIDELEIQKGLLQVAKGLEFLHESAGLSHGNLSPDAIMINARSDWKISGLAFTSSPEDSSIATSVSPISLFEVLHFDSRLPRSVQMNIDYTSPDFIIDNKVTTKADMFSLGLTIIALYSSPHQSPINASNSLSAYKKIFSIPKGAPSQDNNFLSSKPLPRQVQCTLLPRLLARYPEQRLSAKELQQSTFFDNVLVSAIKFLESFPAKSTSEKTQFLRGLSRIINQFPPNVLEKKILPGLMEEVKDREFIASILKNTLKICQYLPPGSSVFSTIILPRFREIFLSTSASKGQGSRPDASIEAGIVIVLENLAEINKQCTGKQFKEDILPIVYLGVQSHTNGITDLCLRQLPLIINQLDYSTITNEFFPVIASVFSKTSSMGIKIRGLEAIKILCGGNETDQKSAAANSSALDASSGSSAEDGKSFLDKYTVQEKVTPLIKAVKTKEPAVMMAALGVFKQIGAIVDADYIAMEILPIIWAFALGPLLNLNQFKEYMTLIKGLSARVEQEQIRKLRELSCETSGANTNYDEIFSLPQESSQDFLGDAANGEDDFNDLVLGRERPNVPSRSQQSLTGSKTSNATLQSSFGDNLSNNSSAHSWSVSQTNPWQTTSLAHLANSNMNTRSITPDLRLDSFTPLKPSSAESSFMQPLQPTTSDRQQGQSQPNYSLNTNSLVGNNATRKVSAQQTSTQNSFAGANGSLNSVTNNSEMSSSYNLTTNPLAPSHSFISIPPPYPTPIRSVSASTLQGTNRNQTPVPSHRKEGLEKYESLL